MKIFTGWFNVFNFSAEECTCCEENPGELEEELSKKEAGIV